MKRPFTLVVAALWIVAGTVMAQEQKPAGKSEGYLEWLKALQRKIEQIAPKKSVTMSTGVAGIRGAKDDEKARLYWKGKKGDEAVTEEELAEFKTAVDLALKGEKAAAVKELEEFIAQFPGSPLLPDARKTLEMVKAEGKEARPAQ